jgi:hypothetical protein
MLQLPQMRLRNRLNLQMFFNNFFTKQRHFADLVKEAPNPLKVAKD